MPPEHLRDAKGTSGANPGSIHSIQWALNSVGSCKHWICMQMSALTVLTSQVLEVDVHKFSSKVSHKCPGKG